MYICKRFVSESSFFFDNCCSNSNSFYNLSDFLFIFNWNQIKVISANGFVVTKLRISQDWNTWCLLFDWHVVLYFTISNCCLKISCCILSYGKYLVAPFLMERSCFRNMSKYSPLTSFYLNIFIYWLHMKISIQIYIRLTSPTLIWIWRIFKTGVSGSPEFGKELASC